MNAKAAVCRARLDRLLVHRELLTWEGLPDGCLEHDVARWLRLRPGEGRARLGSDLVEYRFRVAEPEGFAAPVRLYLREGVLCVLRAGTWSTDRAECARLLRDLGEPSARLDLFWGALTVPCGEWIYPARGLTLAVIPSTRIVAGVVAYRASSLADYRTRVRDVEPAREFRPAARTDPWAAG